MLSRLNETVSLSFLKTVKVQRPEGASAVWKGVPHYDLIMGVRNALVKAGLGYGPQGIYILSRGDADLSAAIPILPAYAKATAYIGFVASNARRRGLEFYVGAMAEDTPLVVDSYGGQADYPHWEYNDTFILNDVCEEAVQIWKDKEKKLWEFVDDLKAEPMNEREASQILFQAASSGLTTFARMGSIWKVLQSTHEPWTGMSLMDAFGALSHENPVMSQMDHTLLFGRSIILESEKAGVK